MIPEEFKHRIINDSVNLIKSIGLAYGAEDGMQLWDTISQVLDPDIKGEIFIALLGGADNDKCSIILKGHTLGDSEVSKVTLIKAIRDYAEIGLYDAKVIADEWSSGKSVTISLPYDYRRKATSDFTNMGITII